jgi:hypothetical protein
MKLKIKTNLDKFEVFRQCIVNCNILFIEYYNPSLTLTTREGTRPILIPYLVGRVRVGLHLTYFGQYSLMRIRSSEY